MKIDENLYIGKRFGSMTILRFCGRYRSGECKFVCKCDCGTEFYAIMREKGKIKKSCDNCRNKNSIKYWFDYNGEKLSITEISKKVNINRDTLDYRILRMGMTLDEAINYKKPEPVDKNQWRIKNADKLRENAKRWRKQNPEKYKETIKRWRIKNADKVRESEKRWRARNPDYNKNYYLKNKEELNKKSKVYNKNYYLNNREELKRKARERYAMKKKEKNNDKAFNN